MSNDGVTGRIAAPPPKLHLSDIDRAKGLGIFLVVLGHLVTGRAPEGADWYMNLRTAIYAFHMPFFIYLSGFIYYYTGAHLTPRAKLSSFIAKRAERLLIPFFIFGLLIVVGKQVAGNFIHVDSYSQSLIQDLTNLLWNTRRSAAQSVWYVFVLFEYTIALIFVHRVAKNRWILLASSIFLSFLPALPILYLDRFILYLPYFLASGIVVQYHERWLQLIDRFFWLNVALFAAALVITRIVADFHFSILLCGFLAIPTLHGLCRRKFSNAGGVLAFFGVFSFVIYLLNTVAIGLAKGVGLFFLPWDGNGFLALFPLMLVAGLFGPILAKVLLFRRIPYLDRLTS